VLAELGLNPGAYGVVTLHRPSNVDDEDVFRGLMQALTEIARRLPLIWPVHPRTRERVLAFDAPPGLRLLPPAGYLDFLALESAARLVLTDSGGVQEETTVLDVPCLTVRDTTERPITVTQGTNTVVGVSPHAIIAHAERVLRANVATRRPALWDGAAGERIAHVLMTAGTGPSRLRPTSRPAFVGTRHPEWDL
jgi:UDP-N-acetylglucosamine 2-epimerase (non-hydrolysing)